MYSSVSLRWEEEKAWFHLHLWWTELSVQVLQFSFLHGNTDAKNSPLDFFLTCKKDIGGWRAGAWTYDILVNIYTYIYIPNVCCKKCTIKFIRDNNPMIFGRVHHAQCQLFVLNSYIFTSAFQQTPERHQRVEVNTSHNRFLYMDVLYFLLCQVSIAGRSNFTFN